MSEALAHNHSHHPQSQHDRKSEGLIARFKALMDKIKQDDCPGLAAELAYSLIQSLIPIILLLVALAGLIGGRETFYPFIIDFIQRIAPVHAADVLVDLINAIIQGSSTGLTIIGGLITLWSASTCGWIIVKGLHRAYGLSDAQFPFWYTPLMSIVLILTLSVVILISADLVLFGQAIIDWLDVHFHLPWKSVLMLQVSRWVLVDGGILFISCLAYALILRPKIKQLTWRMVLPGGLFFVIAWLAFSWLFSLYVEKMNQFNPVYGTLGAVILFVTWLYYSALVFFIGGEIVALKQEAQTENQAPA